MNFRLAQKPKFIPLTLKTEPLKLFSAPTVYPLSAIGRELGKHLRGVPGPITAYVQKLHR